MRSIAQTVPETKPIRTVWEKGYHSMNSVRMRCIHSVNHPRSENGGEYDVEGVRIVSED